MSDAPNSIFREYYTERPFVDRYLVEPERAIDVIVPVVHTNELWRANLLSFYREIPIKNLLIGDGGCIDDSIEIALEFPRVKVLDHREYKTLGYSIRKLIEAVEAEWFTYIHSDAYLPVGWFDAMARHQGEYDWFGCPMQHTIMVEYDLDYGLRPWAGAQMGRRAAFGEALDRIEDDYVYRQEDFVFSDVVARTGGREGKVADTFHYHQTMRKESPWARKVTGVHVQVETNPAEEARTWDMQGRGIVKYLQPEGEWVLAEAVNSVDRMIALEQTSWEEFAAWVEKTNPAWLPYIRREMRRRRMIGRLRRSARAVRRLLSL
jgi:hypothetical protein